MSELEEIKQRAKERLPRRAHAAAYRSFPEYIDLLQQAEADLDRAIAIAEYAWKIYEDGLQHRNELEDQLDQARADVLKLRDKLDLGHSTACDCLGCRVRVGIADYEQYR